MNQLYPLKFKPIIKDKIWGGKKLKENLNKQEASDKAGESWEISSVEGDISVVSEGFLKGNTLTELVEVYMGDLVGEKVYDKFGLNFPLLIKFIDANDDLSIQVHPDDETAYERHQSYGKTEMWYIIEAEKDARLISGFQKNVNREKYMEHLNKGSLEEILNFEETHPGDIFYMPSGRVHAIGSGILLAEIQQTSDVTYRIYDYNRKDAQGNTRELHTEQAIDVIDFQHHDDYKTCYKSKINATVNTVECPYFNTNLIHFDKQVEKDFNFIDSFVIYICVDGQVEISYRNNEKVRIEKGESILIPAEIKNLVLNPLKESKLLEVYTNPQ